MRRSFYPPLSSCTAIKLSDLEKKQRKEKKDEERIRNLIKSRSQVKEHFSEEEEPESNEEIDNVISLYQNLYDQYQNGLANNEDISNLRIDIINQVKSISGTNASLCSSAGDINVPEKSLSLSAQSFRSNSLMKDKPMTSIQSTEIFILSK
ncbi:hypothetical protein TVAG_228690 [Trichomonas vaginalis G3]|uniref:Uncharacterized protein n=1 Tax=Trichomonas vaginalis (strain ATCC PRA-98 / G3) TaxID=412133 RepID=A2DJ31_TRIV3|nr:hypothetical protein TVAGG3_0470810 [Trichomonas vaginalis G3]EAY19606.1 hypothetical protein TVAG_228690 [Trichomonas vaginalis G3]KAI5515046.1 hypothetical protein TVAGG3_0470810 [Trichomonas vaginalis G3]|eukprot:XP_001580592.1 hypothetical protein [Trichomonas vaginalis G3]